MSDRKPRLAVGLDIGGTKIEALTVDGTFALLGRARAASDTATPERLLASIAEAITHALAEADARPTDLVAIGAGIPGQVLPETGVVRLAVNLGLREYPLREALRRRFPVPVVLENDVRLAALGAYHAFQADSQESLVFVGIGTGISAGLILDGAVYRGARGMAGEIGHMPVDPDGARCNCGQRGCLETIVSGPAIVRQARQELPDAEVRHAGDVYGLAAAGDPGAVALIRRVSAHLARALYWLVVTYDVRRLIIGGGLTRAGAAFLDPIFAELHHIRAESRLADELLDDTQISLLPAGYNAGAWGAVRLAHQAAATPLTSPAGTSH